jgi:broad specificity phosphatase PhoE
MTRLLLIRHAEPDDDARGRCYGRLDVGLSPTGLASADRLAENLQEVELDSVYASPRLRAVQTAAALGITLDIDDRLCELDFGELEGKRYDEIRATMPQLYARWMTTPTAVRFPHGESYGDLKARATAAAERIRRACAGSTVLLVTHAGVCRAILAGVVGLDDDAIFRIDVGTARMTVVDWLGETPLVRVVNVRPTPACWRDL